MASIINEGYPGDGTITQLKDTCEVRGWKLVGKLTNLKHGSVIENGIEKVVNIAKYESKEWRTETWKELNFVEVTQDNDIDEIKGKHEGGGQVFIFDEELYVQSKIKRIAGFGVPYQ